jgi:signal transduction histidine kinase
LTLILSRSLVHPLRRLQADALEIATVQLPARVAALSAATDPNVTLEVEPVSVHSTDEIGKVARAFDRVHGEAVRLAGNEALLRGSLNAMFISLSRRSVPLIERLARKIDSLEQKEDDPGRLSSLFSMDHLVTRMRRNSENLLVLAGEEPVRKWSEPVPLTDVARAAASEIEQYTRVVLDIQPQVTVSGQAASDVVHLLAEIIENATRFSPRHTPVHVSGYECSSGGVLLEVRDNGVGLSAARLAEMNDRLDTPPEIDVSVSRHMGLFAVSRLAARHGVMVRLRTASPQGLSALVWLPGSLTGREAARQAGPWPRQPARQAAAAQLTGGGPAVAPSKWFRAERASSASAGDAFASEAEQTTETVSAPVLSNETASGLPSRVPGANLFPGSAAGAASKASGPGETPTVSPRQPSRDTEAAAPARPGSLPRRSAQQARNRLGGFQLGSRAEGPPSREREGS